MRRRLLTVDHSADAKPPLTSGGRIPEMPVDMGLGTPLTAEDQMTPLMRARVYPGSQR